MRGVALWQLAANGFGAVAVVVYFRLLFVQELPPGSEGIEVNLVVLVAYLLLTLVIGVPLNGLLLRRAMGWVRDGRTPTTGERWDTLSQPIRLTFSALVAWIGAAIVFGTINDSMNRIGFGILLVGLVSCTVLYLLLERHFRPVFALALDGIRLPRWRREIVTRVMVAWWLCSAAPLAAIGAAPFTVDGDTSFIGSRRFTLVVAIVLVAGAFVMRTSVGVVGATVNEVRAAMANVARGDLDHTVPVTSLGELGQLQAGFNEMVEGLRERRRLHELFGRQVGTEVARLALEADPELGGERREITALFVDLTGFTTFSEHHDPEEVMAALNDFFEVVITVVMEEGGWVNKFEGDAALCIFGAPALQPDHAARGLRAAARLPPAVAALPDAPKVGVGVATGTAVAGHVGTTERYEYTVIGDTVNVASRLSKLAKGAPGYVLASDRTVAAAAETGSDVARWTDHGSAEVRGRAEPITVFVAGP